MKYGRPCLALVVASIGALMSASLAEAQPRQGPRITLGLGPGIAPKYEGADEYRPIPFVVARARWGGRYFVGTDGSGFRADIVGSRLIEAGPEVSVRFARGDSVTDQVVSRLPSVDRAVEVGGFVAFNLPVLLGDNKRDAITFEGSALYDVTDAHNGYVFRTSVRYRGMIDEKWFVQAGPFVTYGSDNFMSTYYDVTPAGSAASGLPVFDAEGGFKDVGARVSGRYYLTPHWNLNGALSYKHYLRDAAESPIVAQRGSESAWFGGFALGYTF